ncbi:MAG TPA: hypothetical protein VFZ25_12615 [Chloroflexota bacterium]|nr:hypothetical protein [Chloroflexota bacterium]
MELYVLGAVGLIFAAIGFQRGWLREVATLGGLLASWLVIVVVGPLLVWVVNRLALMIAFTVDGGFDSGAPEVLLRHLRAMPLVDPREPTAVVGVALVALVAAAYLGSNRWVEGAGAPRGRILGCLASLANGYLVTYLALRYLLPPQGSFPILHGLTQVANALGSFLPTALLGGVIVTIGLALLSTRGAVSRGGGRVSRARARAQSA